MRKLTVSTLLVILIVAIMFIMSIMGITIPDSLFWGGVLVAFIAGLLFG